MTAKEIAAKVWKFITPTIKLTAIGKIKSDLLKATDTTIMELWEKVKPLFIEEFEEVKADIKDEDAQAAARMKIRKAVEKDDNLKAEITKLLEKIEKAAPNTGGLTVNNQGATIQNQTNIQTNHGDLNFNK